MTKRNLPAHVYARKRKSGTYLYFERGGRSVRLHERPGTPEFQMELARVLADEQRMPTGRDFRAFVASYRESDRYKDRAPRTKADYDRVLRYIEDKLGQLPADKMQRKDVIRARDANKDSARFASYIVQVLRILFEHAHDLGWIKAGQNPAKGVALVKAKTVGRNPWPPGKVEAFREAAAHGTRARLVFEMCIGTGQRIGDVLKMRWSDIDEGVIRVRQNKTDARLWLPITTDLKAALDATPGLEPKVRLAVKGHDLGPTIVQRLDGGPASYRVVADEIMAVRRKIRAERFDIHGLRHATAVELAELGLTDEVIQSVTGHKDSATLRSYTHEARQKARARQAMEAREQAGIRARTSERLSEQESGG
ncbi:tyrosine-type recombinase/integrase [Paracoccus sp. S-4012]|uniref:tyrosine-type recombinase/integrase n=1 Tax=Paracoccus sp. S-4012 TaxID=2665648 RepID=UPI0012AEE859|nr:tyrosine-type recombinase/integrase [Paracoccus sp. S-4012]MRX51073.1 tyrosine-type recombinase/integrase [Paracoccus sp. S-4012]